MYHLFSLNFGPTTYFISIKMFCLTSKKIIVFFLFFFEAKKIIVIITLKIIS